MSKHPFKDWMVAVRPWSFPASAMPVLATLCYLFWKGAPVSWPLGLWALASIVLFHAAGNTLSDWFDYRYKVDAADTFGSKTLTSGMFKPAEILALSLSILAVAAASGIGLMLCTGPTLLWIGLAGVLCTVFYPLLKFNALGDLNIYLAYAFIPTLGTSYVATGIIDWSVLLLSVPIGLITIGILHTNNTRDIQTDRRAGIKTLAMALGERCSILVYSVEMLFPFVWVAACVALGLLPWPALFIVLVIKPAIDNAQQMLRLGSEGTTAIANLDEKTAQLQLMFSTVFSIALVSARFIA